MGIAELKNGRVFLVRVGYDADFTLFLISLAHKQKISLATFTAIGALKSAELSFYDQQTHQYSDYKIKEPCELASCVGNISVKDGVPFVHAHVVLSDSNGTVIAGHLKTGRVFAAEVHMFELLGKKVERKPDSVTALSLWDI